MVKRFLLAVVLAMTFMSVIGMQASVPPPQCDPCPWVN